MNDKDQTLYTNDACLQYLNLALDELQETFELNDIPSTHETSATISIPSGVDRLGFDTTPAFPSDLIEISELYESDFGQSHWVRMVKREFLPHWNNNTTISQFIYYTLEGGRVKFIAANAAIDLKIDYIGSLFNTPILLTNVNVNLPFTNVKSYLEYKIAALCSMYIAENPARAMSLDSLAGTALSRSLGISIKGMQSIVTRRRPFRASFKQRGMTL
jgi:hypothetical protein